MVKTQAECDEMLYRRVYADYYLPLTKCVENFTEAPISVQASGISGAYNFGVRGWVRIDGSSEGEGQAVSASLRSADRMEQGGRAGVAWPGQSP